MRCPIEIRGRHTSARSFLDQFVRSKRVKSCKRSMPQGQHREMQKYYPEAKSARSCMPEHLIHSKSQGDDRFRIFFLNRCNAYPTSVGADAMVADFRVIRRKAAAPQNIMQWKPAQLRNDPDFEATLIVPLFSTRSSLKQTLN